MVMSVMPSAPIVVGFDGSARGEDALALGGLLAALLDAPLVAACVWSRPALTRPDDALAHVLRRDAEEIADEAVLRTGVEIAEAIAVEAPSVPRALGALAARRGAQLIVVGSSRRGRLGRVVAGSVPERLVHDAVTVAVAPAGWSIGAPRVLGSIGVGFDGGVESRAALQLAAALARAAEAPLRVIGVIGSRLVALVPVAMNDVSHAAHLAAIEEREQIAVHETVAALRDDGVDAVAEPHFGEPAATLTARSGQLGLLVLGSHAYGSLRRAIYGSVSTRLLRAAACPLIVLPAKVPPQTADDAVQVTSAAGELRR
jgi:nucleotide-binding universal stress UspA family protein